MIQDLFSKRTQILDICKTKLKDSRINLTKESLQQLVRNILLFTNTSDRGSSPLDRDPSLHFNFIESSEVSAEALSKCLTMILREMRAQELINANVLNPSILKETDFSQVTRNDLPKNINNLKVLSIISENNAPLTDNELTCWKRFLDLTRGSGCIMILSSSMEVMANRFIPQEDIYYDVFSGILRLFDPDSSEQIYDRTIELLGEYQMTDEFKLGLKEYIEDVYPRNPRHKGEAFARDLVYRIKREHANVGVKDDELTGQCIPLYRRTLNTSAPSAPSIIPDMQPQQAHFSELGQNVLILSMSTLPQKASLYCFRKADSYEVFSGVSQLEPGTKLFISELAAQGKKADKIIVFTTEETWSPNEQYKGKSAVDVYSENILKFIQEGEPEHEIVELTDNIIKAQNFNDRIKEIYQDTIEPDSNNTDSQYLNDLKKHLDIQTISLKDNPLQELMKALNSTSKDNRINLFIDLQGGARTFMFTLFATTTLLRDKNVSIQDMFAVRWARENTINPIEILNSEYAIIDLVAGIRSFSQYGKVDELQRFMKNREIDSDSTEAKLLETMDTIHGYMQLNNPEGVSTELRKMTEQDLLNPDKYSDQQFNLIVDDLRETYDPFISDQTNLLGQIEWFNDKAMASTALTFIEDKIPSLLLTGPSPFFKIIKNGALLLNDIELDDELKEDLRNACGGQSYYRPENNILNFGFNKIINNVEAQAYKAICDLWADKLLDELNNYASNGEIHFTILEYSTLTLQLKEDCDKHKAYLKLESSLDFDAWKKIKLSEFIALAKKEGEKKNDTRQRYGIRYSMDEEATLEYMYTEHNLNLRCKVSDLKSSGNITADDENKIRAGIAEKYIDKSYQQSSNNGTEQTVDFTLSENSDKTLLRKMFSNILFAALFQDNAPKDNALYKIALVIQKIIQSLPSDSDPCGIAELQVALSDKTFQITSDSEGHDREYYLYKLWKELTLLCMDNETEADLDMMVSECVPPNDTINEDLAEIFNNLENINSSVDNDLLSAYAYSFIRCRNRKTAIERRPFDYKYKEYSRKNIDLYVQIEPYRNIFQSYFYIDVDHDQKNCLHTLSGIKSERSNELQLSRKKSDELMFQVEVPGSSYADRFLPDTILRLYQALKDERNCTNHASENTDNHMRYRYVKKAISVFVELCKRLEESIPESPIPTPATRES